MNKKYWKVSYARPIIPQSLLRSGYPPLLCQILSLRGFDTQEKVQSLFSADDSELLDPMLLSGMDNAVNRIRRAINDGETVAVYGDYDVDGITSTCLVSDYLTNKGLKNITYIPDRTEEGYGLNYAALDTLKASGVSLIITVDCGVTAVDEAMYAKSLGIDMVITDHHECRPDALPQVEALIDCKRSDDTYPNKHLAGVGVALKLVCACEGSSSAILDRYCDLVAIGTIADVMPLIGENRYLVRRGLKKIIDAPRPGISAMLKESAIDIRKLNASTVGYSLAPRINAAGRLGQANIAEKLLMSKDTADAEKLAHELFELNRKRQSIELQIWDEATSLIKDSVPDGPIILASDKWHQGVIGIAASRLAEQYSLPTVIICLNGEYGKGSCRSYGNFNLFEAFSACSEHLLGFGGHALAAGLNIRRDRLDDFRNALTAYYNLHRPEPVPEVKCDLLITDPALLSIDNVKSLDFLEPYGNANPKPTLFISGAYVEAMTDVGGGRHLRIRIRLGSSHFDCIFFSHCAKDSGIAVKDTIDIAFTPQINEYRGVLSVQLVAAAVRPHDPYQLCEAILSGESGVEWAAADYCPDRADFVKIWRSMSKDHRTGKNAEEIILQCIPGMCPEKYCNCLMVFKEVGLLSAPDGSIFNAHRTDIDGKADLEASRLLRSLRSFR